MGVDNRRVNVEAECTTSIGGRRIDHVVRKPRTRITREHHRCPAFSVRIGIDMGVRVQTLSAVSVILHRIFHGVGGTRNAIRLTEGLLELLLGRQVQCIVGRLIAIVVVHVPAIGVGHVDLRGRISDTEGASIHTLRDELFREFLLELEERALIVTRKADSDINLRGGVRTDVDGVGLIGV